MSHFRHDNVSFWLHTLPALLSTGEPRGMTKVCLPAYHDENSLFNSPKHTTNKAFNYLPYTFARPKQDDYEINWWQKSANDLCKANESKSLYLYGLNNFDFENILREFRQTNSDIAFNDKKNESKFENGKVKVEGNSKNNFSHLSNEAKTKKSVQKGENLLNVLSPLPPTTPSSFSFFQVPFSVTVIVGMILLLLNAVVFVAVFVQKKRARTNLRAHQQNFKQQHKSDQQQPHKIDQSYAQNPFKSLETNIDDVIEQKILQTSSNVSLHNYHQLPCALSFIEQQKTVKPNKNEDKPFCHNKHYLGPVSSNTTINRTNIQCIQRYSNHLLNDKISRFSTSNQVLYSGANRLPQSLPQQHQLLNYHQPLQPTMPSKLTPSTTNKDKITNQTTNTNFFSSQQCSTVTQHPSKATHPPNQNLTRTSKKTDDPKSDENIHQKNENDEKTHCYEEEFLTKISSANLEISDTESSTLV